MWYEALKWVKIKYHLQNLEWAESTIGTANPIIIWKQFTIKGFIKFLKKLSIMTLHPQKIDTKNRNLEKNEKNHEFFLWIYQTILLQRVIFYQCPRKFQLEKNPAYFWNGILNGIALNKSWKSWCECQRGKGEIREVTNNNVIILYCQKSPKFIVNWLYPAPKAMKISNWRIQALKKISIMLNFSENN